MYRFAPAALASVLLLSGLAVQAQPSLQSPAEFLGYDLGDRFTPHHRVVEYVRHVAEQSDRVVITEYGQSYEGRSLVVAFISSPESIVRLEAIRQQHLRVVHGESDYGDSDPALVWLAYNVHGNESSSTEAALETLHLLASGTDRRTVDWLENTVIVLDPLMNPDGRDRYVHWYHQTAGRTFDPSPLARERNEPWPGGRSNHYYFDLNRDWAWATQQETRHRLALYNQWMPHVHVDFHEQSPDAPYYFPPAAEPFHEVITPWQRAFQEAIGINHRRYFDERDWLYFTRQRFDLFYPGYGDTWPTFNGAIGMTYEQAGGGRAGLGIITQEGDTLSLRDRIDRHVTTGLSTIEVAVQQRLRVLDEFEAYFAHARSGDLGTSTYIIPYDGSEQAVTALVDLLGRQGIAYGTVAREVRAVATVYGDDRRETVVVRPGDLLVSTRQSRGVLVDVLFSPQTALSDSITYDITAWSLPYAFNVDTYVTNEQLSLVALELQSDAASPDADRPYAYLVEWNGMGSARFLARLLEEDVRLRSSLIPFEQEGRRWPSGTLIVTRTGNSSMGARFDTLVREAAAEEGLTLHGVGTGFVASGADFGSSDVVHVRAPRVAVIAGSGISPYAVGEVWHFFDEQLEYPLTLIDQEAFDPSRLQNVDVLILPHGSYGDVLSEKKLSDLRDWVSAGGRLIALEGAVGQLAGKDGFAVNRKEDGKAAADTLQRPLRAFGDREREAVSGRISGAVYAVDVDPTHPLGFGYGRRYYTLKRNTSGYDFLAGGWNAGTIRSAAPVAGFAGSEAEGLTDTLVFGQQPMGRGQVIYLVDNPIFRGFWYGGKMLFANAVFMAGAGNR
ncbi:MAG: M14 metallopeptidase family protein [Bacteroidota bacterium]